MLVIKIVLIKIKKNIYIQKPLHNDVYTCPKYTLLQQHIFFIREGLKKTQKFGLLPKGGWSGKKQIANFLSLF